jgi:phage terminase small subunit
MPLNKQQEIFCQHYVLSRNGTESAKQAGYSAVAAANQASRLLKREDIKLRIEDLEGTFTTEIDVIKELEKQYTYANTQGHTNSAIKALEMLSRARGNSPDNIDQTSESLEKDIIRCMEILGEAKVVDLVSQCNWNYSLPTAEEQAETEEMIKKQTVEDKG